MKTALQHALLQAQIFAEHRDDRARLEINGVELRHIHNTYYSKHDSDNWWESDVTQIERTFKESANNTPTMPEGNKCECGDHDVMFVIRAEDGDEYFCGTCANKYECGFVDALYLAKKNYEEYNLLPKDALLPNFRAYPAWLSNLYLLYEDEE